MPYTPINTHVFAAAYAGALAGMGVDNRVITGQSSANYSSQASVAGTFAQAFDTQWGALVGTIDEFQFVAIQETCEGAWQDRFQGANDEITSRGVRSTSRFLLPATYTNQCKALIALIQAGESYYTAQGATPPVWPPQGGGTGVVFQPGGVAQGNIYTTWASAVAACRAIVGPVTLYFDETFDTVPVIASGTYDFGAEVTFQGVTAGVGLVLASGVIFSHSPIGYYEVSVASSGTTPYVMTDFPTNGIICNNASLSGPLYRVTTGIVFDLRNASVISSDIVACVVATDPNGTINVQLQDNSRVDANALEAGVNGDTNHPVITLIAVSDDCFPSLNQTVHGSLGEIVISNPEILDPHGILSNGITADRPDVSANNVIGTRWFDTTLGIPIWWDGTQWVNALGAAV